MIHSVYMFYGPESGQRVAAIQSVQKELKAVHADGLDVMKFYAVEDGIPEIIANLSNGALFSSHTLAIIQGAEGITKKTDIKQLADFAAKAGKDITLIFTSEQSKLEKGLVDIAPPEARKIFWELFDNQKAGWVSNYLRQHRTRIDQPALDLFLSLVENNTMEMQQELDKILLLCADQGEELRIDEDMIERYIYHSKEESIYTLFDAYVRRDFSAALDILRTLRNMKSSEETGIIIRFTYLLRQLASLSAIRDQRPISPGDYRSLRIFGKRSQSQFERLLKILDSQSIRRQVASCGEFEMQLRRQKGALHGHISDLWLYSLMFPETRVLPKADRRLLAVDHQRYD